MSRPKSQKIAKLAEKIGSSRGPTETIYILDPEKKPTGLNIVGGPSPVLDKHPKRNGEEMVHALTVDLQTMPLLKDAFPGARAFSVFVANPSAFSGAEVGDKESVVVALTEADIARGFTGHAPAKGDDDHIPHRGFSVTAIEVPSKLYKKDVDDEALDDLKSAIYQANGTAGGSHLAGSDKLRGRYLLAVHQEIVNMNLGDGRHLVVYAKGAFCGG